MDESDFVLDLDLDDAGDSVGDAATLAGAPATISAADVLAEIGYTTVDLPDDFLPAKADYVTPSSRANGERPAAGALQAPPAATSPAQRSHRRSLLAPSGASAELDADSDTEVGVDVIQSVEKQRQSKESVETGEPGPRLRAATPLADERPSPRQDQQTQSTRHVQFQNDSKRADVPERSAAGKARRVTLTEEDMPLLDSDIDNSDMDDNDYNDDDSDDGEDEAIDRKRAVRKAESLAPKPGPKPRLKAALPQEARGSRMPVLPIDEPAPMPVRRKPALPAEARGATGIAWAEERARAAEAERNQALASTARSKEPVPVEARGSLAASGFSIEGAAIAAARSDWQAATKTQMLAAERARVLDERRREYGVAVRERFGAAQQRMARSAFVGSLPPHAYATPLTVRSPEVDSAEKLLRRVQAYVQAHNAQLRRQAAPRARVSPVAAHGSVATRTNELRHRYESTIERMMRRTSAIDLLERK